MADDFLIPYAKKDLPSYYRDITGDVDWTRLGPVCRDITGDGHREMIVRLGCCTGGSLSPWAIFKHNPPDSGEWPTSKSATTFSSSRSVAMS
jgi:hypothetical protein